MPNDRKTALVLADGPKGFEATAASLFNVKKNGKAFWEVKNYSSTATRVDIVFKLKPGQTQPVTLPLTSQKPGNGSKKWPEIKADVVGPAETYLYEILVNGQVADDPQLEIEP